MHSSIKILPHHLDGVYVWSLSWPFQHLDFSAFLAIQIFAGVLGIIFLLQDLILGQFNLLDK